MTGNDQEQHVWGLSIRILHWMTLVVVGAQVAMAFALMGGPGMATMLWLPLHMSLGVTILGIVLIRIILRAAGSAPARKVSPFVRQLSSFIHASLYAAILAVIITGWLAYRPTPFMPPARLFASFPMPIAPDLVGIQAREFAFTLRAIVWVFVVLIGVHTAAALMHSLVLRDGTLGGMLFGRKARQTTERAPQER